MERRLPASIGASYYSRRRACEPALRKGQNNMGEEKPKIACLPNGPYYLLNDMTPKVVPNIRKSNGDPCHTIAGVALCRCGGSQNKPFCEERIQGQETDGRLRQQT